MNQQMKTFRLPVILLEYALAVLIALGCVSDDI